MAHELWVHVGAHRTGTTSIQKTLATSREALLAAGLVYPADLLAPSDCAGEAEAHHFLATAAAAGQAGAHLKAVCGRYGPGRYLLSSERFERLPPPARISLAEAARASFAQTKIVLYLREPVDLALSRAAMRLRQGKARYAELCASPPVYAYRKQVTRWIRAFGRNNLVLRVYDRARLTRGDVIDDLLAVVGLDAATLPLLRSTRNASLSLPAALVLDEWLKDAPPGRPVAAARALVPIPGPRFTLPERTLAAIADEAAADVAWLREEHGIVFPAHRPAPLEAVAERVPAEARAALEQLPAHGPLYGLRACAEALAGREGTRA